MQTKGRRVEGKAGLNTDLVAGLPLSDSVDNDCLFSEQPRSLLQPVCS